MLSIGTLEVVAEHRLWLPLKIIPNDAQSLDLINCPASASGASEPLVSTR